MNKFGLRRLVFKLCYIPSAAGDFSGDFWGFFGNFTHVISRVRTKNLSLLEVVVRIRTK
jgi:hypothetical protein